MKKIIFALACLMCAAQGFAQEKTPTKQTNTITPPTDNNVYTIVQKMPEFRGGKTAMYDFIRKNFRYPELPELLGIEGRVEIRFVVRKNGKVEDISVVKSVGYGLDEEAIRLVKVMPKWKPALQDGNPVEVYFSLPITFKLEENAYPAWGEQTLFVNNNFAGKVKDNESLIHGIVTRNVSVTFNRTEKGAHIILQR